VSSADEQTQKAGQLIERLLLDAPFRAAFRKDPAGACRELGLGDLAEELGAGGKSMHTLELRESKSSLAGVVMAVAAEGIGVVELHGMIEHGLLKGNLRGVGERALRGVNPMHPASSLHSELRSENPLSGASRNPLGAAERGAQLARGAEQSAGGAPGSTATAGGSSDAPGAGAPGSPGAGAAAPGGQAAGTAVPGGQAAGTAVPGGSAAAAQTPGGGGPAAAGSAAGGGGGASASSVSGAGAGGAAQAGAPAGSAGGAAQTGGSGGGAAPWPTSVSGGGAAQAGAPSPGAGGGVAQTVTPAPGAGGGVAQTVTPTPGTGGGAAQTVTPTPGTGGGVAQTVTPTPGTGSAAEQAGTPTPSAAEAQAGTGGAGAGGGGAGGAGAPIPPPEPPSPGAQPAAGGAVPVWPEPSQAPGGAGAAAVAQVADLPGQASSGGTASGLAELLDSPHLAMPPDVRAIFAHGAVDPRMVSVLDNAVAHHNIVIGDIETSTEPVHAQAIDIISVDGQPVGPSNVAARDLITEIAAMEPGTRPNEVGTPWPIQSQGFFTDLQHQNRLHLAFTSTGEYDPQAPGGSAYPAQSGLAASSASPAAGTGAAAGAETAAGAPGAPGSTDAVAGTGAAPAGPDVVGAPAGSQSAGGIVEQSAASTEPAVPGSMAAPAQDVMGTGGGSGHASAAAAEAAAALRDPNWSSAKAHAAYEIAKSELGVPYLWGGTSPKTGFDCSGLVQYAYGRVGIHIPRVAAEQFDVGTPVGLHQLREGDLVFFKESNGYIHHVGIYVGDYKFIQAPCTGQNVDYGDLREPYFAQQFAGGRRIVPLSPLPTADTVANRAPSAAGEVTTGAANGSSPVQPVGTGASAQGASTPGAAAPGAAEGAPGAAPGVPVEAGAPAGPAAPGIQVAPAGPAAPGVQVAPGPLPVEPPPQPGTAVFKALQAQEASYLRHTVKFLQAVALPSASPAQAAGVSAAAQAPSAPAGADQLAGQAPAGAAPGAAVAGAAPGGGAPASVSAGSDQIVGEPAHAGGADVAGALDATSGTIPYPGDNAPKAEIAQWMGDIAQKHGLPRELPVMAALVESSLHNDNFGDRDSLGYFQMRTSIWDNGAYAGYPNDPSLQVKWFIDQALAVKSQMSDRHFGSNPANYGEWIDEIERPAEEYRGRYQLQLNAAQELLGQG
jgi:cell wall-associated NlpC family hydrolase